MHNRIRDKVKFLDAETQNVISNPNSPLNEKIYQKNLRDYVKALFEYIKSKQRPEAEERRFFVHLQRVLDCLALEDVFAF